MYRRLYTCVVRLFLSLVNMNLTYRPIKDIMACKTVETAIKVRHFERAVLILAYFLHSSPFYAQAYEDFWTRGQEVMRQGLIKAEAIGWVITGSAGMLAQRGSQRSLGRQSILCMSEITRWAFPEISLLLIVWNYLIWKVKASTGTVIYPQTIWNLSRWAPCHYGVFTSVVLRFFDRLFQ